MNDLPWGCEREPLGSRFREPHSNRMQRSGCTGTSWRDRANPLPGAPRMLILMDAPPASCCVQAYHVPRRQCGGNGHGKAPPPPAPVAGCHFLASISGGAFIFHGNKCRKSVQLMVVSQWWLGPFSATDPGYGHRAGSSHSGAHDKDKLH